MTVSNGPTFHFREITPKDFYLAQVLRQADKGQLELIERLIVDQAVLDKATASQARQAIRWVTSNLLDKTVLTLENWLEISYHLCKQRWDSSVEWLETQPMSKINLMIDIVKRHAEEQEKQMKKRSRKK